MKRSTIFRVCKHRIFDIELDQLFLVFRSLGLINKNAHFCVKSEFFFSLNKFCPHLVRKRCITFHFIWPNRKKLIIKSNKLLPVFIPYQMKMIYHPTFGFKMPFISHSQETKIMRDIREKWELPATDCSEISDAISWSFTGD